ncbi:MAG: cache domain-containing protein, partial [Gammaproteobacteria bacterium]|nr:cache domain-containing protein [Gammaproteobacteria bacterium]
MHKPPVSPLAPGGEPRSPRVPERRYLNYVLLAGLLLLQMLTVGGILLSQHFEGRKTIRVHLQQMMTDAIVEIEDNIHAFLALPQSSVVIAQGLFSSGYLDLGRQAELERFFFQQLDAIPQLNGMYYGDEQGRFLYVMRAPDPTQGTFHTKILAVGEGAHPALRISRDASFEELNRWTDLNDAYDPRTRPWYVKAQREKQAVWTDPYVFFTSRQPGITSAAPVLDADGKLRGVVGVDIEISALSRFLAGQTV